MEFNAIPYSETGAFSQTVLDYLDDKPELRPFYAYPYRIESAAEVIEQLESRYPVDRDLLLDELQRQYEDFEVPGAVSLNLEKLGDANTFTVTTAHQLNLFGGPLYYIFKILNTVRACRDLKQRFPDREFVPCYWMGSEDHDFEEVNHVHLFNKPIEWTNRQGGPLGRYQTDGIRDLLPDVKEIIRKGPYLDELMDLMDSAYARPVLADAVRELLLRLFGHYGLVVIDGNTPAFKSPLTDVIKEELTAQTAHRLVVSQLETLDKAGYGGQAHPRPINLFLIHEQSRDRITADGDNFKLAESGKTFSRQELLDLAEHHPERFSPNVILRPLHQQMVLPNIAYIGGGSEIAYWMQLLPVFEHYQVHFPMLLLRTSAQLLLPHHEKKLDQLGFEVTDIFRPAETLKKAYIDTQTEADLSLDEQKDTVREVFESLQELSREFDPSLDPFIGAEGQKAQKSLENISKRLVRAEKQRHDRDMNAIEKLKDSMFPDGSLQERKENFMPFYAEHGPAWFDELLERLDPFEKRFVIAAP